MDEASADAVNVTVHLIFFSSFPHHSIVQIKHLMTFHHLGCKRLFSTHLLLMILVAGTNSNHTRVVKVLVSSNDHLI